MSDETAATVAAASDEDFAQSLESAAANETAGISDNQDGLDVTPIEDKETPVVEDLEKDPTPDPVKDPDPNKDPNADPNLETHDINATLDEEDPNKDPDPKDPDPNSEPADNAPRFVKDAKNLAEKWDTLSEGEKLDKVKNLAKNRPHTFNALAKELGTSTDLLLTQHELDSTDYSKPEDLPEVEDPKKVYEKAKADARSELEAEQKASGEAGKAERNRYVTEVSNYAKHNKLDAETTKAITDLNGDLFKKFESLKYDPATGQELSVKGRLKIALSGSEVVNDALIEAGIMDKSKRVLAGVNAALPKSGRTAKTAPIDAKDVAESDNDTFGKKMDQVATGGVVPIEL